MNELRKKVKVIDLMYEVNTITINDNWLHGGDASSRSKQFVNLKSALQTE